jgi:Gram-negative porin
MNSIRAFRTTVVVALTIVVGVLASRAAIAEVSIAKSDTWELYTDGRLNAFLSYSQGDGNPIPLVGMGLESIPLGGGLNAGVEQSPGPLGPDGMTQLQGTVQMLRVRSGFVPNVLGFGLRKQMTEKTSLHLYISFWGLIEPQNLRKTDTNPAQMQEGWAKVEGPWGSFLAGRALSLFSRGSTENDFLYAHGYALGFPGNIDNHGNTAGMIGFGVLAVFFSPGMVYTTPSLAGLRLSLGVYDPSALGGGYDKNKWPRPEVELTYDAQVKTLKLHLFANAETQDLYRAASDNQARSTGAGAGGRLELGPWHLGVAGHYGKGLGLGYALESGPVSVSQNFVLRTFRGASVLGQYSAPRFDINLGYGFSEVFMLDSDKIPGPGLPNGTYSLPKQVAYSAVFVFHATPNYHLTLDFMRMDARWTLGEKQVVNFVSTGVTATW